MGPGQVRISHLIYGGMILLIGVVFWLAHDRYALLDAIRDDFAHMQQAARINRVAADAGGRLGELSAAIREYVASEAIEPPARIDTAARVLREAIALARGELPGEGADVDAIDAESALYMASFDAVATARRQRQSRLERMALAAGGLRAAAVEAGQLGRFLQLREAELNYLMGRNQADAARVLALSGDLARALHARVAAAQSSADLVFQYDLAFARVTEIYGVLDQATVPVLDEHDARLRALMTRLGRRAQTDEGSAVADFRDRLAGAIERNIKVSMIAMLLALAGAFLFLRNMITPLDRMTTTMTAIADGDYARAVPYAGRRDEIGQMARALETFRNALLGLKSAQTQAETASRHKSDFIANMSHELRTPLNAIIGLSEMLLEDADHPDSRELRESLPRIASSARHLLSVINEILELSKIEAGRMSVEVSSFSPAALAAESLATVAPIARQKGLLVAEQHAAELPVMTSDARRVRQILINLLGNAAKFTDTGEVRLEVTVVPAGVQFAVSDTGLGIARDDLERLFQDFTQLDASPTRKFGGTGLGLALSRRMARLIGGDITVKSELAHGSTFYLVLPVVAPQAAAGGFVDTVPGPEKYALAGAA